jgi:hypothetical protein
VSTERHDCMFCKFLSPYLCGLDVNGGYITCKKNIFLFNGYLFESWNDILLHDQIVYK